MKIKDLPQHPIAKDLESKSYEFKLLGALIARKEYYKRWEKLPSFEELLVVTGLSPYDLRYCLSLTILGLEEQVS